MPASIDNMVKRTLPLVSICIPAYNAERFIAETLESALAQDYPYLEFIVSDDYSTDRTPEIALGYAERGVRLIRQEKNLGMHSNWNAVIRASQGKYVVKLDADDVLEPKFVSSMATVLEAHPRVTFAHCAIQLMDVDGRFLGYERSIRGSFICSGFREWPRYVFGPRAVNIVIIRKSAFDAAGGYDERYAYSGDWKMHRDLLKLGEVFYNDRVLARYRVHQVGKIGISLMQAREHLMHLADLEENWPPEVPKKERLLAQARRYHAWGVGRSAAYVRQEEAEEILQYLPLYGNFLGPRLLAWLIRHGGGSLYRTYWDFRSRLRRVIKKILYKAAVDAYSGELVTSGILNEF